MKRLILLLVVLASALLIGRSAEAGGQRRYRHIPYHNPAYYSGRATYAGSRYGFYNYWRPPAVIGQPVPKSMWHYVPSYTGAK